MLYINTNTYGTYLSRGKKEYPIFIHNTTNTILQPRKQIQFTFFIYKIFQSQWNQVPSKMFSHFSMYISFTYSRPLKATAGVGVSMQDTTAKSCASFSKWKWQGKAVKLDSKEIALAVTETTAAPESSFSSSSILDCERSVRCLVSFHARDSNINNWWG